MKRLYLFFTMLLGMVGTALAQDTEQWYDVTNAYIKNHNFTVKGQGSDMYYAGWDIATVSNLTTHNTNNVDVSLTNIVRISARNKQVWQSAKLKKGKYKLSVQANANAASRGNIFVQVGGGTELTLGITQNSNNTSATNAKNWFAQNAENGKQTIDFTVTEDDTYVTYGVRSFANNQYNTVIVVFTNFTLQSTTENTEGEADKQEGGKTVTYTATDYQFAYEKSYHALYESLDFNYIIDKERNDLMALVPKNTKWSNSLISGWDATKIETETKKLQEAYTAFRNFRFNLIGELADMSTATQGTKTSSGKVAYIGRLDAGVEDVNNNRWQTTTPGQVDFAYGGVGNDHNKDNEHWSGNHDTPYINQHDDWTAGQETGYPASSWDFNINYNVIPMKAGTYIIKYAARRSANMHASLKVEILSNEKGADGNLPAVTARKAVKDAGHSTAMPITYRETVNGVADQTVGWGIDVQGHAIYFKDPDHSFCQNDLGRGWAWCYLIYEITDEDVKNYSVKETVEVASESGAQQELEGVRVRYSLDAYAREKNQYISVADCSLYKFLDDEIGKDYKRKTEVRNTSTGWGTVCLPFTTHISENARAFKVAGKKADGKAILCEEVSLLIAGQAYVYKGPAGKDVTFTEAGYYSGAYEPLEAVNNLKGYMGADKLALNSEDKPSDFDADKSYVMQNGKWKKVNKQTFKFGQYRAYLTALPDVFKPKDDTVIESEGTPSRMISMGIDNSGTSGIDDLTPSTDNTAEAAIYNLNGQKVDKAYKGIVIKNGKKYIMK